MAKAPKVVRILGDAKRAPVDRFRPNPRNDNTQSAFMFGKLKATILAEGFISPIIVRSGDGRRTFPDGMLEIVGGEHRWRAMVDLGATEVSYVDLGSISDHLATKILINLNKLHGESDEDKLSAMVRELSEEAGPEALASLALDEDTIADLLDEAQDSIGSAPEASPENEYADLSGPAGVKISPRDVLVILDLTKLDKKELATFVDVVRQWAYGRDDQGRPAWMDLSSLLVRETVQKP